eukprot:12293554-Ditylum_brightwellii.AAC.1
MHAKHGSAYLMANRHGNNSSYISQQHMTRCRKCKLQHKNLDMPRQTIQLSVHQNLLPPQQRRYKRLQRQQLKITPQWPTCHPQMASSTNRLRTLQGQCQQKKARLKNSGKASASCPQPSAH